MRVLLRDLAPGQDYAIQFRSNNGEEVSEWSQVQRFTTTSDTIPPSAPLNLSWYNSGSTFIAEWDPVTTQATSPATPLKDFRHYRCAVNDGVKTVDFFVLVPRFELSKEMNVAAFGTMKSALTINVRAVDLTYNESAPISASINPADPPVPAAAVLSNYFGSILVTWSGRDSSNAAMPSNIDYVEVHLGTTNNFTASDSTIVDRIEMNRSATTQRALLTGLTNGTTYYVRLRGVSLTGRKGNASAISNGVTKDTLTGLDIKNGQIGTDQINFTARQIGGANVYYSTSQPTGGTYKEGDIWYDTDNGYTTYRHNGTTWVLAPEVGVISGQKILAGTLTADAVGTNLIIAAKANIGNAIIDSSHIDQLSANKITAGVLQSSFTVNYGGVVQPAWSLDVNGNIIVNNAEVKGQMVVGNSSNTDNANAAFSIKSFNYVAGVSGWTINGNGTVEFGSATMRGSFRTATSGRRVEIVSGGSAGTIQFYAPDGDRTYIKSVTENNAAGIEALQLGIGDPFDGGAWNRMVINLGHGGHLTTRARVIEMVAGGDFRWFVSKTSGGLHTDAFNAMGLDSGGWTFRDANTARLGIATGAGVSIWDHNGFWRFGLTTDHTTIKAHHPDVWLTMRSNDGYTVLQTGIHGRREFFNNGEVRFNYAPNTGSINFTAQGTWNASPAIAMFTGSGHGNKLMVYQDNRGQWFEIQAWNGIINGNGWAGLRGSEFQPQSDIRLKENIEDVSRTEMLSLVRKTRVTKYNLKYEPKLRREKLRPITEAMRGSELPEDQVLLETVYEEEDAPLIPQKKRLGLIAQEAPTDIVDVSDDGNFWGVGLYGMTSMIWAAVQAIADKVDALEARIIALEPKGPKK